MRCIKKKASMKLLCISTCLLAVCLSGAGCAGSEALSASGDIVTQKNISDNKTPITILVKYAFSINAFEEAVEIKFPDIDIVQVGNYTHSMGVDEYEARMKNDNLTDIVMTWPMEAGEEYMEERLLDLSGIDFTSNYNLSMLNTISSDGKLYYLPGPAQVRGIVYNKTLFAKNGWEVPSDFEGFISLCKEIEASGIRSIQLPFENPEVLDTAFTGYGYADCYSKPQNIQQITDYNNGIGRFGDIFMPALSTFERMIDEGIWKESDLEVSYSDREAMLFSRQCAMVEDSVLLTRMGYNATGTTDEFGLMPFFNPGAESDWGRIYMVCYIGLNKHLAEPQNEEKYALVLKLMEYISTAEGQKALSADTGAMLSSVKGVPPPDIPEIEDMLPSLEHGRYGSFFPLENAQSALRDGLSGMLKGEMTKEEVCALVDDQNANPPVAAPSPVLGEAEKTFSLTETGNFIADALRAESGCDVALFLDNGKDGRYNGKGVSGQLYKGEITQKDINRIFPDLKHGEKGVLCKVTMTGLDLLHTLEYSLKVDNNQDGWFYYFSGLKMEYAPSGIPGSRIINITDLSGNSIDREKLYTVAVMDQTVSESDITSIEETDSLIIDILSSAVKKAKTISPASDGRFIVVK